MNKYYNIEESGVSMEDKPRYSKVSDAIALILLMQSKFNGISLSDIQEELNVSRRTAERMRDCLLNVLPQIEELDSDDRCKRWGFRNYSLPQLVSFTPSEIATLENLKQNCNKVADVDLKSVITKIKALNNKKLDTIENEIEFILHSEGMAVTQKPNYKINLDSISVIRQAIKDNVKISGEYNGKKKLLSPLGLIYGEKVYLVAREENKGMDEYNYLLHKLSNLRLTTESFDPMNFNLQEFSKKSFGVYQNKLMNVELLFSKEKSEDVLNYNFHPTQKIKENEDDTITVKFKASGELEILWHIFKWGNSVKIVAPKELKKLYKEYLENVLINLK